ncbi:MAG: DsbA family protein [Pseudomonadota bacterium]|nr:DsbA family protein [Pseudomonadota bacterium]
MADLQPRSPLFLALAGGLALLVGAGGGWALGRQGGTAQPADFDARVHDYIVAHPEVLVEAADALRSQGSDRQLAEIADKVVTPYPGAVLGNPNGKVTLVEFTDFACTYCRGSVADVEALIAANPDLRVVVRELPIIAPTSPDAARWGLAAAEQGKYPAFHKTMFAAGRTDRASIEAAARVAGLDLDRARKVIADPRVNAEIASNLEFARKLQISGTPSWVAGKRLIIGAVGREQLAQALIAARES